jgi:acyl-CoA reductase-like NAD-dependent aldehyde dehydrogenase
VSPNAAIAAVCGDTVVWKPAEPTPLCAVAVQKIANQVMADHGVAGVFTLAVGTGAVIGERMLTDARLPLVSFTGSTAVGRRVSQTVAVRFGQSLLELGGKQRDRHRGRRGPRHGGPCGALRGGRYRRAALYVHATADRAS